MYSGRNDENIVIAELHHSRVCNNLSFDLVFLSCLFVCACVAAHLLLACPLPFLERIQSPEWIADGQIPNALTMFLCLNNNRKRRGKKTNKHKNVMMTMFCIRLLLLFFRFSSFLLSFPSLAKEGSF